MHISHKYRFVFLATSHAASTSAGRFLAPYCEVAGTHRALVTPENPFHHHTAAVTARRLFLDRGWDWDAYRHFCIVRNPYDRVVSMYHFHKGFNWVRGAGAFVNFKRYLGQRRQSWGSFRRFVLRLDTRKRPNLSLRGFICDRSGAPLVEDVLRFEELQHALPEYVASLGVPVTDGELPRLNTSPDRRDYRKYYDDVTRAHVEALFEYEFARFGYQF